MRRRAHLWSGGRGPVVGMLLVVIATGALVGCGGDDEAALSPPDTHGGTTLDVDALGSFSSAADVAETLETGGVTCTDLRDTPVDEKSWTGPLPIDRGICTAEDGELDILVFEGPQDVPPVVVVGCGDESAQALDGTWVALGNRGRNATVEFLPGVGRKEEQLAAGREGMALLWAIQGEVADEIAAATGLAVVRTLVDCEK